MPIYFTLRFKASFPDDTNNLTVIDQHQVALDVVARIETAIKDNLKPYEGNPEIVKITVDGYEEQDSLQKT